MKSKQPSPDKYTTRVMSTWLCWNVMVGISWSKVLFLFGFVCLYHQSLFDMQIFKHPETTKRVVFPPPWYPRHIIGDTWCVIMPELLSSFIEGKQSFLCHPQDHPAFGGELSTMFNHQTPHTYTIKCLKWQFAIDLNKYVGKVDTIFVSEKQLGKFTVHKYTIQTQI